MYQKKAMSMQKMILHRHCYRIYGNNIYNNFLPIATPNS